MAERQRWVALAAVVPFLAACGQGNNPEAGGTASPPSAAPPTTVAVDYRHVGSFVSLGDGMVQGASRDGSVVYVTAVDPTLSKPGCQRNPEPVLFRQPLSGTGREVLTDATGAPVHGTIVRGKGGSVAVVAVCEEELDALWVGSESPEGRLHGLRRLDVTRALSTVAWAADGQTLLGGTNPLDRNTPTGAVMRIDPTSGATSRLFDVPGGVSQVGQLADGSYLVATRGGVSLRDAGGRETTTVEGFGFTISPDGRTAAVYGSRLLLLTPGDHAPVELAKSDGRQPLGPADFSPDGRALAVATSVGEDGKIAIITVADQHTTTVRPSPGRYLRLAFTGDGRGLVFTRLEDAPPHVKLVLMATRFDG